MGEGHRCVGAQDDAVGANRTPLLARPSRRVGRDHLAANGPRRAVHGGHGRPRPIRQEAPRTPHLRVRPRRRNAGTRLHVDHERVHDDVTRVRRSARGSDDHGAEPRGSGLPSADRPLARRIDAVRIPTGPSTVVLTATGEPVLPAGPPGVASGCLLSSSQVGRASPARSAAPVAGRHDRKRPSWANGHDVREAGALPRVPGRAG